MIILNLTIADEPFNCGSSNIRVSIKIRGTFFAIEYHLEQLKRTKSKRTIY